MGAIVLIVGAVLAVVAGVALSGRIADKVSDQYDSFVNLGSDQGNGSRLTAGGGNRYDFWRVALNEFSDHPLEGVGAGNYPADYFLQRRQDQDISQPHSLPLQTLAELGLVGGVLLLAFVAAAVAGLWRRARRRTGVADTALAVAAGGAFLAWLGASLVDWIHLFPGLAAIALGAVAVLTVDDEAVPRPTTGGSRLALAGVVGLLAVLASVGHRHHRAGRPVPQRGERRARDGPAPGAVGHQQVARPQRRRDRDVLHPRRGLRPPGPVPGGAPDAADGARRSRPTTS